MLPNDPDWYPDDGNEEITHDFQNAIQRSVDAGVGANTDDVFPPPKVGGVPTSLPWGGGRLLVYQWRSGIGPGLMAMVDDGLDYRNRLLILLGGGAYDGADHLPGHVAYAGAGHMQFTYPFVPTVGYMHYTEDGSTNGDPPAGGANYFTMLAAPNELFLFADSANGGRLTLRNGSATETYYPVLVLFVSDQFPTRT